MIETIPTIKVKDGENILPRWYCGNCGTLIRDFRIESIFGFKTGYKFCPECGIAADYTTETDVFDIIAAKMEKLGHSRYDVAICRRTNTLYTVFLRHEYFGVFDTRRDLFTV